MKKQWLKNFILLALMLAASGLSIALRPTHRMADARPSLTLDMIVPHSFADWQEEKQFSAQIVDPQQKEEIDKLYSQTVTRTYVNRQGYRIMLSIAYGPDQRDSMQVHRPEICYPAQGFILQDQESGTLALSSGSIPITRIMTNQGQRYEPVTYWITVGDNVVASHGYGKKLIEMRYALHGKLADGMLVRFSSIDPDTKNAYAKQSQFAIQLMNAISAESRPRFVGSHDES